MRVVSWSVLVLALSAACGGDGVTLPGPGDPTTLVILGGDEQRGSLGEPLTEPLVVRLLDSDGLPVRFRLTAVAPVPPDDGNPPAPGGDNGNGGNGNGGNGGGGGGDDTAGG